MCIEFRVKVKGCTSDLICLTEALAKNGVNLSTIALEKNGSIISFRLYPENIDAARDVLRSLNADFEEKEVILVEIEDRIGHYADVARKLSDANVDIYASHLLTRKGNMAQLIFDVNKISAAREILGDQILEFQE